MRSSLRLNPLLARHPWISRKGTTPAGDLDRDPSAIDTNATTAAVGIQVGLLIPWHDIISEDIEALEKKDRLLEAQLSSLEKTDEMLLNKVETLLVQHVSSGATSTTTGVRNKTSQRAWYQLF